MTFKRSREDGDIEAMAMANCLMLLSQLSNSTKSSGHDRVFVCKTCNREFSSFQALGGHRASHKRPKLMASEDDLIHSVHSSETPPKPKTHECSICGVEFPIGQALGGHMRRHRAAMSEGLVVAAVSKGNNNKSHSTEAVVLPVLKRSHSSKRVMCLDLNLTPYENDLKLKNMAPLTLDFFV